MYGFRQPTVTAALLAGVAAALSHAQTFTTLANFSNGTGATLRNETAYSLVQGPDGNFYGTARDRGANDLGTIFKMTPDGTLTALYSFTGQADGQSPTSGLALGSDGNFYGTNSSAIFKITPAGTFTTLYNSLAPGSLAPGPFNGLVRATDGNFYGMNQANAIFKITPAGVLTVLHTLSAGEGFYPFDSLIQASDGNFYGTTTDFGPNGQCTIFKMTSAGTVTVVASLPSGSLPVGPLLQAMDGNFYGVTEDGGSSQSGTIFKMTPGGTLTTLYIFSPCSPNGCTNGSQPQAGLIQGKDGNLYGTTGGGGANNGGTIFQLTPAGALTTLHSFARYAGDSTNGLNPEGTLLQAGNGTIYGTTNGGGTNNFGTVFSLQLPAPPYTCANAAPVAITSIDSASAYGGYSYFASGSWLEIKGTNLADPNDPRLANASHSGQWASADFNGGNAPTNLDGISVEINGKPAYVWYLSPTQLNVQAPEDSASGNVAITVTNCKATSSVTMFARRNLAPGLLAPPNYASGGTPYLVATFYSDGAYVLNTSLGASFGLNSRPAKPGDLIIAYGIGFGDVTPAILPGVIVGEANALVNPVTFSFGATPAALSYQGLAGSFVGLYEFYITVPEGLADGDYQINVTQNGTAVPQTMYLTVHNVA